MHSNKHARSNYLIGRILVAHPVIQDEVFKQCVILVGDYYAGGITGVILNRPYHKFLSDINYNDISCEFDTVPIYYGGPCDKGLYTFVAWVWNKHQLELYYAIELREALILKKKYNNIQLRGYRGYVNIPNIHQEINRGLWIVFNGDKLAGLDIKQDELWSNLVQLQCPNSVI